LLSKKPSYSAKAEYPVITAVHEISSALEYWVTRWSLSSGSPEARPGGG